MKSQTEKRSKKKSDETINIVNFPTSSERPQTVSAFHAIMNIYFALLFLLVWRISFVWLLSALHKILKFHLAEMAA